MANNAPIYKKWWFWAGLVTITALVSLIIYFKIRQRNFINAMNAGKTFTADDAAAALQIVFNKYGADMARNIEKVARLETGHFTSTQYQKTGTGGMNSATSTPPYYGWGPNSFFAANPSYTPIGLTDMVEAAGLSGQGGNTQSALPKGFVIMPSVEAWMMFLAYYATKFAAVGGISHWYSTDPARQSLYMASLKGIQTPFTDSIENTA